MKNFPDLFGSLRRAGLEFFLPPDVILSTAPKINAIFHLTNKIKDKPQMEIPLHSCTVSYITTLLFLSSLLYVFYGGGDTCEFSN